MKITEERLKLLGFKEENTDYGNILQLTQDGKSGLMVDKDLNVGFFSLAGYDSLYNVKTIKDIIKAAKEFNIQIDTESIMDLAWDEAIKLEGENYTAKAPDKIACLVIKKSRWTYRGESRNFKSVSLEIVPGNYYSTGDETSPRMEMGVINLSACESVETFFDKFEVGQKVEIEIKVKE